MKYNFKSHRVIVITDVCINGELMKSIRTEVMLALARVLWGRNLIMFKPRVFKVAALYTEEASNVSPVTLWVGENALAATSSVFHLGSRDVWYCLPVSTATTGNCLPQTYS